MTGLAVVVLGVPAGLMLGWVWLFLRGRCHSLLHRGVMGLPYWWLGPVALALTLDGGLDGRFLGLFSLG